MLYSAVDFIRQHPNEFWMAVRVHLSLSLLSLAVAVLLCVPLGIVAAKHARASVVIVNLFGLGRTIPSLAVLALAMPYLGLGFKPSLIALTLLACPPILLSTHAGFKKVDPAIIEAAYGMGMDSRLVVSRVEFPLALPAIMAGIRIAAVEVIASAALASIIGGGGLGDFIIAGINMADNSMVLVGAIPVAVMALAADLIFSGIERLYTPPSR
jgi:osmoprotectant transport system permease protein